MPTSGRLVCSTVTYLVVFTVLPGEHLWVVEPLNDGIE